MHGIIEMRGVRVLAALLVSALILLGSASPATAQKDKKKKKNASAADSGAPVVMIPDEPAIDYAISEMLGAWQVGDAEKLHKAYADDVSVVSGVWEPPVVGWANYLADYQKQRARLQQVRLDRQNTYVRVIGNTAWACYQWDFSGVVDGQPSAARGQTTLVLEKRNARWLIVHNHTSLVQTGAPARPAPPPGTSTPTQPESKPPLR